MIAVLLAGGKGTRLAPFTISLPKPLMPVGNRPILEILIKQLKDAGVTKVVICVGYLESLIRSYFGDGSKFGVEIIYSSETEPLGTAGPMKLIESYLTDSFFFMNGDLFTDINLEEMFRFHKDNKAVATIGLTRRTVDIDFGVIKIDQTNEFTEWKEKPTLEYLVSMGIYVFEPAVLKYLPDGYFNVPDLIIKLHEAKESVKGYQYKGNWLDIGRLEDYQRACQQMEEIEKKSNG
ncbi:MAG: NTP transferase domain-containing protein [Bacteroidetes bacterium]|nr:NTP transferase domain-containing protein [Bacteroidota bacterium]MBX7239379.1 NTP transferase domain-containing protein [Bacteroidia bacterium]MCC7513534.1 NTP transferase domain-containing protein [Bacteroidia bacterium]MCW5919990.1 NTP transferase domain-containing protein [Bacteroidota bacterium]HCI58089.1 nucleoside-diphosphate-sugar pyrophosphorylase [Bacteroidota bacterium]